VEATVIVKFRGTLIPFRWSKALRSQSEAAILAGLLKIEKNDEKI
tara:strand:- start:363 stop:497 length:135 start_codon:yes stop_codon:yes gene_type:complete